MGFSTVGFFRTRLRYCAPSPALAPWPTSSSVFRFMVLNRAGFTCDICGTQEQESAWLAERVEDTRHASVLARQKPQPDLQTPGLWLDCRPRAFAKHPRGATVNPLMWRAGSNQMPRNGWRDTRSCWTMGPNCCFLFLKKTPIPEKQGAIRHETIEVTLASVSVREDS